MTDADVDGAHIRSPAAHVLLPLHARAYRARLHLHRAAAHLRHQERRTRAPRRSSATSTTRRPFPAPSPKWEAPTSTTCSATRASARWTRNSFGKLTMEPPNRLMLQVEISDAARAERVVSELMGEQVELAQALHPGPCPRRAVPRHLERAIRCVLMAPPLTFPASEVRSYKRGNQWTTRTTSTKTTSTSTTASRLTTRTTSSKATS